jgi:3-hydroxyisobutyrate dehydrogenase-like beta-hydroxyacid dehydrogenase
MNMSETLGFIGLGNMGEPIAANLMKEGYGVRVYNRTASKTAQLVQKGASIAPTSADVATPGGIVFTMLSDDAAVESVCLPAGSFVERLGPGGIHVSLSTISPAAARRLAEHHKKYQVEYVASPVFGRPAAVAARTAWLCTSGSVAAKARVKSVLEATSQAIFDFGDDPGGANVVKLCGNFLIASAMESLAEVFALARKNGIDPNSVADFFGKTLFACPIYQTYGKLINVRQYEPAGFRLVLGLKDINLALQTAASSSVPMPVASLLRDRWLAGVAKGRGDMDWSVIALGVAEDAGLD